MMQSSNSQPRAMFHGSDVSFRAKCLEWVRQRDDLGVGG